MVLACGELELLTVGVVHAAGVVLRQVVAMLRPARLPGPAGARDAEGLGQSPFR